MPHKPPRAAKRPTPRNHHGDLFVDDYEWLRDRDNPEVIAHLEAENRYTDEQTAHLEVLQEQIFEEIKGRTQESDLTVPVRKGDWWYFTRTVEGMQYPIHCRAPVAAAGDWEPPSVEDPGPERLGSTRSSRPGEASSEHATTRAPGQIGAGEMDGTHPEPEVPSLPGEQRLLDENAEARGHDFFALGSFDVDPDGRKLLYALDTVGDERYTIRIRDLDTGEDLPEKIPDTFGGAIFDASGKYVFYTTFDDAWRPDTVWRHEVGTAASADVRVFHEPDEKYWVGASLTRSRKYLLIELASKITSETRILPADDPTGRFQVVWPRREGVEYTVEHAVLHGEDRLLIVHNDGALDFELVDVPAAMPHGERRVLVPHEPGVRIESVDAFESHLVLEYRRDALPRIAVARLDAPASPAEAIEQAGPETLEHSDDAMLDWRELEFGEELYSVAAGRNPEWRQPRVRLGYASFVTPDTVYDYVVETGELAELKRRPVLGGYEPAEYTQRREWAIAEDGTRVPISLVYRTDWVREGEPSPLLLYGYGSYEHSIDPSFSIPRLSLLDRGMIFAVAHVRGGGELGRSWYEMGKTFAKCNTITDFAACARHLIENDWTSSDRLVAEGGSAGGLLMGAVANHSPGCFAGILADVPFVDPLTSILDPSLPLTVIEWDEWGDPLHDPEAYAYIKRYSPYENVRETGYPRILAITSLHDTRVLYVEPAKWVARLREVGAPVLLRTELSAGHGGVSGRYHAWRQRAFEYAWLLDAAGLHLQTAT